jgi:pimeloyl-ACP methyl ester carboxylesterase
MVKRAQMNPPGDGRAAESADAADAVVVRDLTARGVRVRFSEAGTGAPVFLLHGFLQTRASFEGIRSLLARSFRVIVPDFPGFGESEKPDPVRYAYGHHEFASVVADLASALSLGRVSVCGAGMGASVALMFGGEHKDLVHKLVLISPVVYEHTPNAMERVLSWPVVGSLVMKQVVNKRLFSMHLARTLYKGSRDEHEEITSRYYDAFNTPASRQAAHATLRGTLDSRPLVAALPRIVAPTLIVCGRNDTRVPLAHARKLSREIAGANLAVLDCGHAVAEEAPSELAQAVTSFLGKKR